MNNLRKYNYVLISVLLILFFSTVIDLSDNRIVDSNHKTILSPVVQTKITSIQGMPTINNNNEFTGAGFIGFGNITHPYVLDGNVYGDIETGGPSGIDISNTDAYFVIKNIHINSSTNLFAGGVKLENVTNGEIINTTVTKSEYGFYLINTSNTILVENNATGNNYDGFYLTGFCNFNNLTRNIAVDNGGNGFFIRWFSNNNTLTENSAINNAVIGFSLSNIHNNTFIGNFANESVHGFNLWESSTFNNLTKNIASENTQRGFVLLASSNNNSLFDNEATENMYGFFVDYSDYNEFVENNASDNIRGFDLSNSNNNTFTGNTVNNNDYGFDFDTACNDNKLTYNFINGSLLEGIILRSSHSDNIFTWNTIKNSGSYGVYLDSASNNLIYYNLFIDNNGSDIQGYDATLANSWDNGTHGNYWSDYTGIGDPNGIGVINYTLEGSHANDTKPIVPYLELASSASLVFEVGSIGQSLSWTPSTNFPFPTDDNLYTLYQNGSEVDSKSWIAGTLSLFSLDYLSLPVGVYNFTIVFKDTFNNQIKATTIVTVTNISTNPSSSTTPTTSSSPSVSVFLTILTLICTVFLYKRRLRRKE